MTTLKDTLAWLLIIAFVPLALWLGEWLEFHGIIGEVLQ